MTAPAEKSDRAFRTISEAADIIGVPQHVLRFWETRFPQLQPLKRAGNRRYYSPADMALLESIRSLLHDRGLTIRGAKLLMAAGEASGKAGKAGTSVGAGTSPGAGTAAGSGATTPAALPAGIDTARLRDMRDRLQLALSA
jgi:DNA-binding transcriptional MerR regulator